MVIGENEYGRPFTLRLRGKHFLGVGATGVGQVLADVEPTPRAGADDPRRLGPGLDDRPQGRDGDASARPLFHRWAPPARTPSAC